MGSCLSVCVVCSRMVPAGGDSIGAGGKKILDRHSMEQPRARIFFTMLCRSTLPTHNVLSLGHYATDTFAPSDMPDRLYNRCCGAVTLCVVCFVPVCSKNRELLPIDRARSRTSYLPGKVDDSAPLDRVHLGKHWRVQNADRRPLSPFQESHSLYAMQNDNAFLPCITSLRRASIGTCFSPWRHGLQTVKRKIVAETSVSPTHLRACIPWSIHAE